MTAGENRLGIVLVLVGMASFSVGDAFVKHLGDAVPLGQIIAARGLVASALLVTLLLWREGLPDLHRLASGRVALRTAFEIGATVFFLSAIMSMPIADATAILQAIPLSVTFFGSLFLGERVGWRRYSAILVGLVGILIIVRPGSEGMSTGAVFALLTVVCSTGRDLVTRRMPSAITSLQIVTVTTIAVTLAGVVWMLRSGSVPLDGAQIAALSLAGLAMPIGLFCVAAAVRIGELAVVTPFRYSIFIWALGIGWIVFGERPDAAMLVGTAVVLASGLYTLWREARLNRDLAARSGKRGAVA